MDPKEIGEDGAAALTEALKAGSGREARVLLFMVKNPAQPNIHICTHVCYTTIIPRVLVREVMQDFYHQQ